jgi:hypothetical protein
MTVRMADFTTAPAEAYTKVLTAASMTDLAADFTTDLAAVSMMVLVAGCMTVRAQMGIAATFLRGQYLSDI